MNILVCNQCPLVILLDLKINGKIQFRFKLISMSGNFNATPYCRARRPQYTQTRENCVTQDITLRIKRSSKIERLTEKKNVNTEPVTCFSITQSNQSDYRYPVNRRKKQTKTLSFRDPFLRPKRCCPKTLGLFSNGFFNLRRR